MRIGMLIVIVAAVVLSGCSGTSSKSSSSSSSTSCVDYVSWEELTHEQWNVLGLEILTGPKRADGSAVLRGFADTQRRYPPSAYSDTAAEVADFFDSIADRLDMGIVGVDRVINDDLSAQWDELLAARKNLQERCGGAE